MSLMMTTMMMVMMTMTTKPTSYHLVAKRGTCIWALRFTDFIYIVALCSLSLSYFFLFLM